jgi:hypothetical protein
MTHLKAFFTRQDMLDDWNKCCGSADKANLKQLTMTKDGVQTVYLHYNEYDPNDLSPTYGREFSHIYADVRLPREHIWFIFTRLRSIEQTRLVMELFHKVIH